MRDIASTWQFWALLSAGFAALTAVFAKVGLEGVGSDYATLLRTCVILLILSATVPHRSWLFIVLSGLATGASWLCYFRALKLGDASRVAPVDKLSVVLVAVFGVLFLGERLSSIHWLGVGLIFAGVMLLARVA